MDYYIYANRSSLYICDTLSSTTALVSGSRTFFVVTPLEKFAGLATYQQQDVTKYTSKLSTCNWWKHEKNDPDISFDLYICSNKSKALRTFRHVCYIFLPQR